MEKASLKLNSIKLVSGNSNEPGKIVTGKITKFSPEQEEQKENYHPFLQMKTNVFFLGKKKYSKGKVNSRKSSISKNALSKSSTQEVNNVKCIVSCA